MRFFLIAEHKVRILKHLPDLSSTVNYLLLSSKVERKQLVVFESALGEKHKRLIGELNKESGRVIDVTNITKFFKHGLHVRGWVFFTDI